MQKMANLAVSVFILGFFILTASPPPSEAPEGLDGIFFSGKEEGYGMTLRAKNGKPGCISFRFMNFYSQRGNPPPSDAPEGGVILFSYRKRGST